MASTSFVELMQELFDFDQHPRSDPQNDFPLAFDAMHAVTGPYAKRLFEELLGAPAGSVRNGIPSRISAKATPTPTSPTPMIWRSCCWKAMTIASGQPATATVIAT